MFAQIVHDQLDPRPVALVDDDLIARRQLRSRLEHVGMRVVEYDSGGSLLVTNPAEFVAVCLCMAAGDAEGMEVLRRLRQSDSDLPVVVITAEAAADAAVAALRAGAWDHVTRATNEEQLLAVMRRAVQHRRLATRVRQLSAGISGESDAPAGEIVPLRDIENREIARALTLCNGSVRMAARKLGIGRATLYRKLAALRVGAAAGEASTSNDSPLAAGEDKAAS